MSVTYRHEADPAEADIVAFDANGAPALLVLVKGMRPVPGSVTQLFDYLRSNVPPIPFGLLADPERLRLFRLGSEPLPQSVADLSTEEVLRPYDPGSDDLPFYETYLTGLLVAWLDDFSMHWKFEAPPANEVLRSVGLLPLLEGGTVERGVQLAGHPLY